MAFYRRAKKSAKTPMRSRRKVTFSRNPKKAPSTKAAAVALIKSVVAREQETKFCSELLNNNTTYNSQIATPDIVRLLPSILQSAGESATYEREGRQITPKRLHVQADVSINPTVTRALSIVVVYYVLQSKAVRDTTQLSSISLGDLLRTGDVALRQGFNGYVQDWMLPINTAAYTVMKKGSFLLGKNDGSMNPNTSSTGNQPMFGNHIKKSLSFDVKVPAKLTYEEDVSAVKTIEFPKGFAPFIVFGYYHQDHSTPDVLFQDISVTMRTTLTYDDA